MSEALMHPAVYYHTFTQNEATVDKLRDAAHRFAYVMEHAAHKLDTCELHEFSQGCQVIDELIRALDER